MIRKSLALFAALPLVVGLASRVPAAEQDDERIDEIEERLQKVERDAAVDRLDFGGDFRFEAHSITASVPAHVDGLALQRDLVDTIFYFGRTGTPPIPGSPGETPRNVLDSYIGASADNYVAYQQYLAGLTYGGLQQVLGSFSPDQQQQLMQLLLSDPRLQVPSYDADNSILYTNRLRLEMRAKVADNVDFMGRLAMYKVWGDSTGVQVFDGSPGTFNIDGTTVGRPNSDILRVERAFFDWKDIGGLPIYLSIGRRPSTEGAPLNLRNDELRGGTPLGSVVNYQFDGITFGWHLNEYSTARLCYGVGYESGFGNGELLKMPADRLDDAQFLGVNWDIWSAEKMFVQSTVARAFDVTDGFNGLIVLPKDPLTGQDVPAPVVLRYTPSANLGDIDLASALVIRRDGPVDWFVSVNYMKSHPDPVTTPFGGLFSDPFQVPEEQDGTMYWVGVRFNLNEEATKVGLEYNHGSQYWFNFAQAEDDIIAPKTNTRGDVWEAYLTHRIHKRFIVKASYIDYSYDYSQSGWHVGQPKDLDATPILGFPTYDKARKLAVSLIARF